MFGTLAAIGLAAAVIVHALTFYPRPSIVTEEGSPVWVLGILMFVPFTAMVLSMPRELGRHPGFRKRLSIYPRWARIVIIAAIIYTGFNLISFQQPGGQAEIRNGRFVLAYRGAVRNLSEEEYLAVKRDEVRAPSEYWAFFFLAPTLYFFFRRSPRPGPPTEPPYTP
jgi:hypothetical protein